MATSLKLPPELKARVVAAAKKTGKSAHAFMVEAIEQQTAQQEKRQRFVAEALKAEQEAVQTGLAFDADEVHAAMALRARRGKAGRPKARAWRK